MSRHLHALAAPAAQVPLNAFTHFENDHDAAGGESSGSISRGHAVVQFGAGRFARSMRSMQSSKATADLACLRASQASFQGTAAAFQASLANEPILILAAVVTVYIVLGVLYESYIHPLTILSTLPSAGVGALLALI